jgi:hypothetical protein
VHVWRSPSRVAVVVTGGGRAGTFKDWTAQGEQAYEGGSGEHCTAPRTATVQFTCESGVRAGATEESASSVLPPRTTHDTHDTPHHMVAWCHCETLADRRAVGLVGPVLCVSCAWRACVRS